MYLVWQDQSAWEWVQKLRQNVLKTNLSNLLPSCRNLPLMQMKKSNESRKMNNYFSLNHLRLVKKGTSQLGFWHSTCSWQYTAEIINVKLAIWWLTPRLFRGWRSARLWLEIQTVASKRSRHVPMEPKEQRTISGRSSKGHRQKKNKKIKHQETAISIITTKAKLQLLVK